MPEAWTVNLSWWITAVEIPVLAGMFWLIWRTRRDAEQAAARNRRDCEAVTADLRERLSLHRLDVTKNFASIECLKDLERRLTGHLVRIETKLDNSLISDRGREPGGRP
ncbi:MAG: hypothetical protein ISR48_01235 [Alphaproteobacteria bacterium]|nr:hypothetical protein [Alphaproteobacteria bacterium]